MITLKPAIKDLQTRIDGEFCPKDIDDCEDMKLGIEALKGIKKVRKTFRPYAESLLLGEIED